jgi:hypothetical protein
MDLDTSWIDTYEKISSIQENYYREPMTKIPVFFIYMNGGDEIIKVIYEEEELGAGSTISSERLLRMIEEKRHINNSVYKLVDLLRFVVDIEPENLQGFVGDDSFSVEDSTWLKPISYTAGHINIPSSIFIFHELNHLYFFFRLKESGGGIGGGIKSILKSGGEGGLRVTKKVRIMDTADEKKKFKEYLRKSMRRNRMIKKGGTKKR